MKTFKGDTWVTEKCYPGSKWFSRRPRWRLSICLESSGKRILLLSYFRFWKEVGKPYTYGETYWRPYLLPILYSCFHKYNICTGRRTPKALSFSFIKLAEKFSINEFWNESMKNFKVSCYFHMALVFLSFLLGRI